jgi:glyoxylase-like metal-dependent hydrolase (beta-lactamase superfamily II)
MVHLLCRCGFSHTAIIEEDGNLAVIDVGSVGTALDIKFFIENKLGLSLTKVAYILITHFHIDHIAGLGRLLAFCPAHTRVFFHPRVQDYLNGTRSIPKMKNWKNCLWPAVFYSAAGVRRLGHFHFETLAGTPLPLLRLISHLPFPQERISYFDFTSSSVILPFFSAWRVIETPGHTEDSCSFFNTRSGELISGDWIVDFPGFGPRLNPFSQNWEVSRETFRRLKEEIRPQTIYPAHGRIITGREENVMSMVRQ